MRQPFIFSTYTAVLLLTILSMKDAIGFTLLTPTNARWANNQMTLTINSTDFGDGSFAQQAILRGIESWYRLNVPGSALEVNYQTAAIDTTHGNDISGITLGPVNPAIIALTARTWVNTNPPTWKDMDIKLSNSVTWQDDDYAVDAIQFDISPTIVRNWKRRYESGASTAVKANEDVVPASELQAAQARIRELERALGRKTMEVEILRAAQEVLKKSPSLRKGSGR
jgi:transposase-like protein